MMQLLRMLLGRRLIISSMLGLLGLYPVLLRVHLWLGFVQLLLWRWGVLLRRHGWWLLRRWWWLVRGLRLLRRLCVVGWLTWGLRLVVGWLPLNLLLGSGRRRTLWRGRRSVHWRRARMRRATVAGLHWLHWLLLLARGHTIAEPPVLLTGSLRLLLLRSWLVPMMLLGRLTLLLLLLLLVVPVR